MRVTVQVVRRELRQPKPGSAEPEHPYSVILTTRAAVKTLRGLSQFAQVSVGAKVATHTFTIRFTTIPIDIRNRLRDASGKLYQILSVEPVNLGRQYLKLQCSDEGSETTPAAR